MGTNSHHEGSIDKITDATGALTIAESFTAFGARRATTWSGPCPCPDAVTIASISREGFTGEDTIGGISMGLNHMNGRVQDAISGRFLSPDPKTQDPSNTQSWNRYSYVHNNPLTFTDPTGFEEDSTCTDSGCGVGGGGSGGGGGGGTTDPGAPNTSPGGAGSTNSNTTNPGNTSTQLAEITVIGHYSDAPNSPSGFNYAPIFASAQFRQYGPGMNFVGKAFIGEIGIIVAFPVVLSASVPAGGSVAAACTICMLNIGADATNFAVDVADTVGGIIRIETTNIGSALETALESGQQAFLSAWKYIQTISGP